MSLLWQDRVTLSTFPGQFRITVPIHGGSAPTSASAALTRKLDGLWVDRPGVAEGKPTVTSVVAIVQRGTPDDDGDHESLTLLLTADNVDEGDRIDDAAMGRQIDLALEQLAAESGHRPYSSAA